MAVYDKINNTLVIPYGEENSVASFYKWMEDLFNHENGYPIYYDKDQQEFEDRTKVIFPSINIQQIDTQGLVDNFIGGKGTRPSLLFYIYFHHHLQAGGSRRLLRRGRDQISFALKYAGIKNSDDNMIVPPIKLFDFSKNPIEAIPGVLTVDRGIQQRFLQDGELLEYEFLVKLSYLERFV